MPTDTKSLVSCTSDTWEAHKQASAELYNAYLVSKDEDHLQPSTQMCELGRALQG